MRIFQVDAFTREPFRGNPAAVCLLDSARDESWMRQVAAEMNLPETAFVELVADGYWLRWFTPLVEVDLCGHATLAAAHVLWEAGVAASSPLRFHTRSGLLVADRGAGGDIRLDFPAEPAEAMPEPEGLAGALGVDELLWVGENRMDYLVEVADADVVRSMTPDSMALREFLTRSVIVTAASDVGDADFVSRVFGPRMGFDEDAVTGSAHCCLGPYWAPRVGRSTLVGYQASARGGYVGVEVAGERVVLSGHAVTVIRGELVWRPVNSLGHAWLM